MGLNFQLDQIHYLNTNKRTAVANNLVKLAQNKNRSFTYYVHWTKIKNRFIPKKLSKNREYSINVNLEMNVTNQQIIKSYFFCLKLDEILDKKLDQKLGKTARQSLHWLTDDEFKTRTQ